MSHDSEMYRGCKITNIHRGKGDRSCFIYAVLVDKDDNILICATLDYILEALEHRLPKEK